MKPQEGVDYKWEDGKIIFTSSYHIKRGKCCGSRCRHCPFIPEYVRGSTKIR